jgi:hypothetical protein
VNDLHSKWQEKVANAVLRYSAAKAATAKAISEREDLPSPDGYDTLTRALRVENEALKEYTQVLNAYAKAVLEGKEKRGES